MTSPEPKSPHPVSHDITEVIVVATPSPVFVDSTGRRSRLLRRLSYAFFALVMVYGGLVSVSLAGGPVSSRAVLPLPALGEAGEAPTDGARAPRREAGTTGATPSRRSTPPPPATPTRRPTAKPVPARASATPAGRPTESTPSPPTATPSATGTRRPVVVSPRTRPDRDSS